MNKMLAAVLVDVDKIELREIPIPEPKDYGEVIVKIKSCGICATDYKAIKGIRKNVTFPCIVGHEHAGVVDSVGPGVSHFKEGDEVIVSPLGYCGFCKHCREGNTHYCKSAFVTGGDGPDDVWNGGFAEYMKTKECCLYHKPAISVSIQLLLPNRLQGHIKG